MDKKILDGEFRNTLYKNLVDAGYDKKEAQKIVGVKYHAALKEDLVEKLNGMLTEVNNENYEVEFTCDVFNGALAELKKVKAVIA